MKYISEISSCSSLFLSLIEAVNNINSAISAELKGQVNN